MPFISYNKESFLRSVKNIREYGEKISTFRLIKQESTYIIKVFEKCIVFEEYYNDNDIPVKTSYLDLDEEYKRFSLTNSDMDYFDRHLKARIVTKLGMGSLSGSSAYYTILDIDIEVNEKEWLPFCKLDRLLNILTDQF